MCQSFHGTHDNMEAVDLETGQQFVDPCLAGRFVPGKRMELELELWLIDVIR